MAQAISRETLTVNGKFIGRDEPIFRGNMIDSQSGVSRALTWYSMMRTPDHAKEYLADYIKQFVPTKSKIADRLRDDPTVTTMGWVSRLLIRGISVPDNCKARFDKFIDELDRWAVVRLVSSQPAETVSNPLAKYMPDLEYEIDRQDPEFSMYQYLATNNVSPANTVRIYEKYIKLGRELSVAYHKTDPQIVEGYSHLSSHELNLQLLFVLKLLDDCRTYAGNQKKQRKPRVVSKKKKSLETVFKYFTYLKAHDQLKVTSIDPAQILGASVLFALNTSNNVLTVYTANEGGFKINRTAIDNVKETKAKRVGRKMTEVLNTLQNGNKRSKINVLNDIGGADAACTNRINSQTVLLGVIK